MNALEIARAKKLYDQGSARKLYNYIKKYLDRHDPYAPYFYSTISLTEWNESYEQGESRRVKLLIESADAGVPEAAYQLACCYLSGGDGVERNWNTALKYIKQAMEKNYEPALATYAVLRENPSNFD
ncbi:SEL1-like repeat protein [Thiofilum flexile]|uniref:SEL1-like repeat protein n=1 Tax=Thiofilum flexile TaxID=125627 RepID=UPI0003812AC0|nr:SEL1-like repeat protein [Thiofilum flexile]